AALPAFFYPLAQCCPLWSKDVTVFKGCPISKRDDISYLCGVLRPYLKRRTMRSHALTVEEQVLTALCFFACSSFYEVIADGIAITKATVGYVYAEHLCQIPRKEWEYVNRKECHSINVQLTGDADLKITNCVVRWPGSVHDARILRESNIHQRFHSTPPDGIRLGDSGYPLLRWLMTPFSNVTSASQLQYITHSRFACLNYLRVEPKKALKTICACIVLHSMAQARRAPLCEDEADAPGAPEGPDPPPALPHLPDEPVGRAVRSALVDLYFSAKFQEHFCFPFVYVQ
uniref:DDE Tnp4 domain-containing protein n=1 Tax=Salarias fasciatus TaxID=181472 RepID=A0A672HB88_SALFA